MMGSWIGCQPSVGERPMKSFRSPLLWGRCTAGRAHEHAQQPARGEHAPDRFDSASGRKGLLGRDGLADGSAMIIATSAVHTFFMRFAIDLAFVSQRRPRAQGACRREARRIAGAWGAFAVLELPAGALEQSHTRRGDLLRITAT